MEASAAMKLIAVEVAAHLGMSRKAATESHTTTGEMGSAKAAAHMTAADASAAAESAPVSTSPAAARKRVGGQSPGESSSRQQHDHGLA
jgi:hypothetical protein